MKRILAVVLMLVFLPGAVSAATLGFTSCAKDFLISISVYNGTDTIQWVPAARADNLRYQDHRVLSCETDTCLFNITYRSVDGGTRYHYKHTTATEDSFACPRVVKGMAGTNQPPTLLPDLTYGRCSCRTGGCQCRP